MKSRRAAKRVFLATLLLATSLVETRLFIGEAHAIIGRPLTPLSYAGVARRTTRRAVAYGAVARPPYYW